MKSENPNITFSHSFGYQVVLSFYYTFNQSFTSSSSRLSYVGFEFASSVAHLESLLLLDLLTSFF